MKRVALAALAAVMGGLGPGPAMAADEGSVVRGGRLYDNWSIESRNRPPIEPHPAFAGKGSAVSAADSWRCSTCHGWDYKGTHGHVGIRNRQGADPAAIVVLLKDATHRYGRLMSEASLFDLANFVSRGQIDTQKLIETERRAKTSAASHEEFYGTICAACHGSDGGRLREVAPIGDAARQRPHEVLHNLINGHPGDVMPPLSALGGDFAVRMLTYVQTLPSRSMSVSIAHGARMYDNWQTETGAPPQSLPHPAYPPKAHFAADAPMTWRCKECHGWDYKGRDGSYAKGSHFTGIKGLRDAVGMAPEKVAGILRDNTHGFTEAMLPGKAALALGVFVSKGQIDVDQHIDRATRKPNGDAKRGARFYQSICAICHGFDGKQLNFKSPEDPEFIGTVANENPWETLHKIRNGQPGIPMPSLGVLELKDQLDILTYAQTLPKR